MKQPELGRKIVELRKAKGLTQEELVEECNLNVRTLQRIESGEVTPRSYTLKMISEALDYDVNKLTENTNGLGKGQIFFYWFKPIYLYVLDLFNLKTDTMRKIMTFLTLVLIVIISLMAFKKDEINVQSSKEVRKTIESIQNNYHRWYRNGMIDSCITIFSDDVCLINNWLVLHGKKSVREQLLKVQPRKWRFIENNIETFNHAGNIAIIRGNTIIKDKDGNIVHTKYLAEWHYIKGKWLEVSEVECVH